MKRQLSEERRTFLKSLIAAGAATVSLAAVTPRAAADKAAVLPEESSRGYRETDHIRNYYRTAGS